jgi:hypothetical protein
MKRKTIFVTNLIFTIYTILAYVASLSINYLENKRINTPGGSLFPIPYPTTGIAPLHSDLSFLDQLIFDIFIWTGILLVVTVIIWIVFLRNWSKNQPGE